MHGFADAVYDFDRAPTRQDGFAGLNYFSPLGKPCKRLINHPNLYDGLWASTPDAPSAEELKAAKDAEAKVKVENEEVNPSV